MNKNKRELLKGLAVGSAWVTPVVSSVVLPVHAETSPPAEPSCQICEGDYSVGDRVRVISDGGKNWKPSIGSLGTVVAAFYDYNGAGVRPEPSVLVSLDQWDSLGVSENFTVCPTIADGSNTSYEFIQCAWIEAI